MPLIIHDFRNLRNISIINIRGSHYCCIFTRISKSEAIRLLQNVDLNEKSGTS